MKQTSSSREEIIEKTSLGVNDIISLISNDRTHIIEVLEILQRENLLITDVKWTPGKKKKLRPTTIGLEFINIIESNKKFNQDLIQFSKTISDFHSDFWQKIRKTHPNAYPKNIVKDMMFLEKYDIPNEIIDEYERYGRMLSLKRRLCSDIFLALLQSYVRICCTYPLSRDAQFILREIVLNEIDKQLNISIDYYPSRFKESEAELVYDFFGSKLQREIDEIFINKDNLTSNRLMYNKLKQCILSLLVVLRPPQEHVAGMAIDWHIDNSEVEQVKDVFHAHFNKVTDLDNLRELKDIYEKHAERENAYQGLLDYYQTQNKKLT